MHLNAASSPNLQNFTLISAFGCYSILLLPISFRLVNSQKFQNAFFHDHSSCYGCRRSSLTARWWKLERSRLLCKYQVKPLKIFILSSYFLLKTARSNTKLCKMTLVLGFPPGEPLFTSHRHLLVFMTVRIEEAILRLFV